ncbi:MAG: rod shape-determining protein [Lachnospiraceae bacterium]|nr:rod shape-determining protein [Lachnospiraceae bacterium]
MYGQPEKMVFGLDIGTRSIVGTVGYKASEQGFTVVAQCTKLHETRAMMDGQIHDIGAVAKTIEAVKKELEEQTGRKLNEVCIAAAGRVLNTARAYAEVTFDEDVVIDEEIIHSLEMLGVENAHKKMKEETKDTEHNFFCVAYTVVHYYLNDFIITNLEEHKASKIGVEVLATFLPDEVIDGLYSAVQKAGLQVENLTLEPIAAMQVAIPENFRLLNIALVDVGAGTSDICITKDGSVVAYGMIPMAGDMLTEVIARKRLVDFQTAEQIKLDSSTKKKAVTYKDIMGLKQKVEREDIIADVADTVDHITKSVAEQIMNLNGGKPVSAVFVVGGGGKITGFTEQLAKHLNIAKERVALRGVEVLSEITFLQEGIKKDPLLVTPIGICLNFYEQKNNFIFVRVNDERIKLYDNGKLTIVDAAISFGYPNEKLFPARGKELTFTVNGEKRMVRGELGEAAEILLNGKTVGINAPIEQSDVITIKESTKGAPATCTVGKLPEFKQSLSFTVNGNTVTCPRFMQVNGELVSEYYEIKEGDVISSMEYYTVEQALAFLDIVPQGRVYVNHVPAGPEEKVYENFAVNIDIEEKTYDLENITEESYVTESYIEEQETAQTAPAESPASSYGQESASNGNSSAEAPQSTETAQNGAGAAPGTKDIIVLVNNQPKVLSGKSSYMLVDVLDVFPFNLADARGREAVVRVNEISTNFMQPLAEGDRIELYWKE